MVALVHKVMVMPKATGDAKFKSERGRAAGLGLTSHLHAPLIIIIGSFGASPDRHMSGLRVTRLSGITNRMVRRLPPAPSSRHNIAPAESSPYR